MLGTPWHSWRLEKMTLAMKRTRGVVAWALLVLGCSDGAKVASDTALRIAEDHLPYADFEDYLQHNADTAGFPAAERLDDAVLTSLFDTFVDEHLLVRLAVDLGLAEGETNLGHRLAAERLLRRADAATPTASEIEAYYERHRSRWSHPEQVHLWQILMVERGRAESIKRELDLGGDFKATASRLVDDPDANYCGDQGWLDHDDLPSSFAELIFALEPETYSDVVAADYGYYIFWVEGRKAAQVEPQAVVNNEIRAALARERTERVMADAITEARTRYNVSVFRTNLPFDYQGLYAEPQED